MKANAVTGTTKRNKATVTERGKKTAKKAIVNSTPRRGRLNEYDKYDSLLLNRTPAAKRARVATNATKPKKIVTPKSGAGYADGRTTRGQRQAMEAGKAKRSNGMTKVKSAGVSAIKKVKAKTSLATRSANRRNIFY